MLSPRSRDGLTAAALFAAKLALSAWVLHLGFTHVSDDDYARVTIAQAFARDPRLDPSGTSWLPFPFGLTGGAMAVFGRSLGVARAVAVVSSAVGAALVYGALRVASVRWWVAAAGVVVAMSSPWSAWLGVATVPEALTASLIVAASLTLAAGDGRARLVGAAALLVATLSRYEAWPVAAVFAASCALSARSPATRRLDVAAVAVTVAGPLFWLAWNAHAHGDALHFIARVAAYRARFHAVGGALYPAALARAAPATLTLGLLASPALLVDPELRRRWRWPFVAMLAMVLFLVEGDLHGGAPTHHPERALVALFWTVSIFGIDGLASLATRVPGGRRRHVVAGIVAVAVVAWAVVWPSRVADYPARSPDEDRAPQLARGADLRARGVAHVTVTPCQYEHFALIAAFEAPERVTTLPVTGAPVTPACPGIEPRVE